MMERVTWAVIVLSLAASWGPWIQQPQASGASAQPIIFSNVSLQRSAGLTTVVGEAQNATGKILSFLVNAGLYDAQGRLLAVASGAITELHPNQRKVFQAVAYGTYAAARAVPQVDVLQPACP